MRMRTIGAIAAVTLGSLASPVSAQDEPRVGITMGYPASLDLVWQVNEGLALRPELVVSSSSNEITIMTAVPIINGGVTATTSQVSTNDNWQASIGVSALFYVSKHDALRTYVSPRWAYTRVSSESGGVGSISSSSGNVNTVTGSFGAQYALSRRFSVFGEVGAGYSRTTNKPTGGPVSSFATASTTDSVATRSGAGVVLYF